jgi:hypothetical protein
MSDVQEKLPTSIACQRAGMSRERLIRRVQAGEIEAELVAGRWLISARSLAEFIRQHGSRQAQEAVPA